MALIPTNDQHHGQIIAGTTGRNKGHLFEIYVTEAINSLPLETIKKLDVLECNDVIYKGKPEMLLLKYVFSDKKIKPVNIKNLEAFCLGGLATSGNGERFKLNNGDEINSSKSDILLKIQENNGTSHSVGISIKTCNNKTPTNAQLFFSTASAFCNLLRRNNLKISELAENAMKMFCGDRGFRPVDMINTEGRNSDPDRWFWEELPENARKELEDTLILKQDEITDVLLRKAYPKDPFLPEYVLHQTKKFEDIENVEVAIFSMSKLINLSKKYSGFELRPYTIKKGRFKDDPNIHLAPRFGVIQMQRGGQKQHPTQLQFNLKAGYFYHLKSVS